MLFQHLIRIGDRETTFWQLHAMTTGHILKMALIHFTLLGYAYPVSFLGALFEMDFHNLVRLSSILNLLDQIQSDMSCN